MIRPTLSPNVADAMAENRPVVALESTIITHGMPFPQNLETALRILCGGPAGMPMVTSRIPKSAPKMVSPKKNGSTDCLYHRTAQPGIRKVTSM